MGAPSVQLPQEKNGKEKGRGKGRCQDHQCLQGALKDSSGCKVVVAESMDALLWGSGGLGKGGSGMGREAARLSLRWGQCHRARC